ncbi:FAD-dependent oxidoreductase [Bombella sp. ESL0385]|uniref:FAD-dependent oxidoreductase n=1 Tax=Bombella sp. ESL0385 TaxID=2676446 RepID=UPI0012D860E4|nr:FAD-dependent oxidoreductase [Bombella sp. ESL0385]MUG89858.1 Rieske 2Fe-2S domain-containing protein [Bombella sp. ESL0385]
MVEKAPQVVQEAGTRGAGSPVPDQTLYDVAAIEDVREGDILPITLQEQSIALVRMGDDIHAIGRRCPHKGATFRGDLACRSSVHGDVVVCPWHKAVFGVRDGKLKEPIAFSHLPVYPVRQVEGRVLVGAHPMSRKPAEQSGEEERVLIVGAGAAAASAIYTLREEGFAGRITLIGDEGFLPYERPALSKGVFLGGGEKVQPSPLLSEAFYARHEIARMRGKVVALDCEKKEVLLEEGKRYSADHILITTGGRPILPPLPGIELEGVMSLHTVRDAWKIAEEITGDQAVILIGCGLTTLETASALRQKGAGVTIIATERPFPMEGQWGREVGQILRRLHEDNGVAFVTDTAVVGIHGTERVTGVELGDGMVLNCTHVLVSVGNKPSRDFLPSHIEDEGVVGGIIVDDTMQVRPGIYAAGDVAAFRRNGALCRIEHWRPAQCEGRAAARSILGLPPQPMPVPWYWTQQFGKKLEYLGWGESFDHVLIEGDLGGFDFMAAYMKGQKVVALVSSGRSAAMARAAVDFEGFVAREVRTRIV